MSSPKGPERCPLCGKLAVEDYRPFCGRGCRDRDLLNWLGDAYRLPAGPAPDADRKDGLDSAEDEPL